VDYETVCFFSLSRQDGEVYLYGIFDGHSGSKVAAFAAQRMPEEILLGQLHGKVTDDEIKDVLKQVIILVIFLYFIVDHDFYFLLYTIHNLAHWYCFDLVQHSCCTLSPVSAGMGDCIQCVTSNQVDSVGDK